MMILMRFKLIFIFTLFFITEIYLPSKGETSNELVSIEEGCFMMGDTFGDGDMYERPAHKVCLDNYKIGKYEVTNEEYASFLNSYGKEFSKDGELMIELGGEFEGEKNRIYKDGDKFKVEKGFERHPVVFVNYYGVTEYVNFYELRLPTEAEWEYAARERGKNIKYSWGNGEPTKENGANIPDLSVTRLVKNWDVTNWKPWEGYDDGFPFLAPVGSFKPNALGLYDMTGNVWEWLADYYEAKYYARSLKYNPKATEGETFVMRGGSYLSPLFNLRLSARARHYPYAAHVSWGFRVAADE